MLVSLNVKNFAIIDNINVEFRDGMTVLTGETGAGKSLIIDAIGLLFGSRASTDLIRYGESKATIEGVFTIENPELTTFLEENGIELDQEIIVRREIFDNGKSTCRVNGSGVTLSQLQIISGFLGDIHTQFDTHRLINPKNYLFFLDDEKNEKLILDYKNLLREYRAINKKLNDLVKKNSEESQQLDFYLYQINEIEKAKISSEEEEQLKEQFNYLNNYGQIVQNINEATDLLNDQTLTNLYKVTSCLEKIEKFQDKYKSIRSTILDYYYNLVEIANDLGHDKNIESNGLEQLDYINERLGIYSDLKRKFHTDVEGIIKYYDEIKTKVSEFENYDFLLAEYKTNLEEKRLELLNLGNKIRKNRQDNADKLVSDVLSNLQDMQLKDTKFEISFNEINEEDSNLFKENGLDIIDFLITFNKGEPVKPLSKVASGGELSRFMLSLKTILASKMQNQTLIFDEIDSGVSGAIAYSIANKIKSISKNCQVLCVTHLPQVAAISNHHLFISKSNSLDNRTITMVNELSIEERIEEVSKMISNGSITDAAKQLAKELLNAK